MKAKRFAAFIIAGLLCLLTLPLGTPVSAATASASLSGPGAVRAGDTIDVTLSISGSGILGASGAFNYDTSKLTFKSYASKHGSWSVIFNKDTRRFSADGSSPINGSQTLITLTFTVNSALSAGESIAVSTQGLQVSDGTMMTVNNASYSRTISAPSSTENKLAALTVSNATLSPAFNENTTSYSAGTVPFSTTKLQVSATPKDSKAKVSVSGDTLVVGVNAVKITVTAESGAQKVYTISVTREQDPNYVGDSNNRISSIKVDGFTISPPFNKTTTSYVVWLPYETTRITVTAIPESSKASVKIEGGSNLREGDNQIKIICTAEDGTVQIYFLIARRAAQESGEPINLPNEKRDQHTGIRLIDLNFALEGDEIFSVVPVNGEDKYGLSEIADRFQLFDITLSKEGGAIQPAAAVEIQIPLIEGYDSSKCKIYRIESDGTKTDMSAEYIVDSATQEKLMVFTTDHFSLYALVQLKDIKAATQSQTFDMIYYIAMPALFIGGGGIGSGIGIAAYKSRTSRNAGYKTRGPQKQNARAGIKISTRATPKLHTRTTRSIARSSARFSTKSGAKRRKF